MSLNGKFLDKDHLQYFWTKIKMKFASAEQGAKADTAVQPSDMETALADKQDTISDLQTIRSGAAAGATALQQSDVTSTYSSSGTAPVNGTAVNVDQQRQDALEAEDRAALIKQVDEGAKNIADFTLTTKTAYTTVTFHGVTITRNGDIFTVSGTSDTNDNAFFNIYYEGSATTKIIPPGNWVALIENYTGDVVKDIAIQVALPTITPSSKVYGTPVQFSLSGSESGNWLRVNLRPSTTYNGSFRLMICSQKDYTISPAFVPYAKTNRELTVIDDEDRAALIGQVDGGAKNLLNCSLTAIKSDPYNSGGTSQFTWNGNVCTSPRGVTFTINSDNSIDVVATSVTTDVWFRLKQSFQYNPGSYVISGCPSGGSTTTYFIESDNLDARDTGSSIVINRKYAHTDNIFLAVKSGATFTGTFKPMICTAADYAISTAYVPYAKTNRELMVENYSQQSEIDYAVNTGVKNFLDVQHPTTTTRTNYTPLVNGGVELSCSNAAWTSYTIANIPVEAGKEYVITFLLDESSGTSNFHFFLRDSNSSGANLATKNYGSTTGKYEASFTPNNSVIWLGIYINNSATAATATAKLRCMIRPASITDSTFQPYAPTNRELYEMIQVLQNNP